MGNDNGERILRSLQQGFGYTPDWRWRLTEQHLQQIAGETDIAAAVTRINSDERDPFVRQLLRFRAMGVSVANEAFSYALRCEQDNENTGAASLIRAMVVADRDYGEIAAELSTSRRNIATYCSVFWDLRRCLGNELYLRQLIRFKPVKDTASPALLREPRWLSVALDEGWSGLQRVALNHGRPATADELEQDTRELHAAIVSRARQYLVELETSGVPPSEEDLNRFVSIKRAQPQTSEDRGDRQTMQMFIRGLHSIVVEKAKQNPDDPKYAVVLKCHNEANTPDPSEPIRMRRRFASA